ncbi:alpha/beta fold hydrolase [Georgenia sp. MJ170]|uniref:alpha/beta fold hydrolase n=1 Tax=Georgenia sunbinii TaxID=3117728 RepID=UPI002F268C12
MSTFVLVPGAGGSSWQWHLVVAHLEERGHRAVAVDLPAGDDSAGLAEYSRVVRAAVPADDDVVLVAQSMGGLVAPIVCTQVAVRLLIMLNAMIPAPGETGGEWWAATGQSIAMADHARELGLDPADLEDPAVLYGHDVPPQLFAEAERRTTDQSGTPFTEPWPLRSWPGVPTRVLAAREDRLFPISLQRRVAHERLGLPVDVIDGGHLALLSRPAVVADRLDAYWREIA